MAALADAMRIYGLGGDTNQGRIMSLPIEIVTSATPGSLQKIGGGISRSVISDVKDVLGRMISGLRKFNDEKENQRIVLERIRTNEEESIRERLTRPPADNQIIERIENEPQQTEQDGVLGQFAALRDILRKIFGVGRIFITIIAAAARAIGGILSTLSFLARGYSLLRRALNVLRGNPRFRLLRGLGGIVSGVAAGAGAIAIGRELLGGRDEERIPSAAGVAPGSTEASQADTTRSAASRGGLPAGASERIMPSEPLPEGFGSLAARYESRGNPGAIGFDNTGGWSYGSAQIATRTGTMVRFLQYLELKHPGASSILKSAGGNEGATAGTEQFKQAWRNLASTDQQFNQTQKDFITDTHYIPLVEKVLRETGVDISQRSRTLQEVVNSTAIQHGARTNIVTQAIQGAGGPGASDEIIIQKIYDERPNRFGSSTAQVQASVRRRFVSERQDALRMLESERQTQSQPTMVANIPQQTRPEHSTRPQGSPEPARQQERTEVDMAMGLVGTGQENRRPMIENVQQIAQTSGALSPQQLQPSSQIPATIAAAAETNTTDVIILPLLVEGPQTNA